MGEPNVIWRLASSLHAIIKAKELLYQCTQTTDEGVWADYFFMKCGIKVNLAIIVDDRLSRHAYIADRILEFVNKNLKGDPNFKETRKDPYKTAKCIKVYDAVYAAILKLLTIELKKLKLNKDTIKKDAYKILDEKDPYFEPMVKHFQETLESIIL